MRTLGLVALAGILFALGDIVARNWGKSYQGIWLLTMAAVATVAYAVFGYLARDNAFSDVAIWVSISLTICSVIAGILIYGDPLTVSKLLALILALLAAYLSSQDF